MRDAIDNIFGAGTSQTVFGDAMSPEAIASFFEGITPYFQKASSDRIQKYTNRAQKRAMK